MAQIVRHGGEAHVMRPDGVMRSSIIQPMFGFNPGVDVMANANAFTMPPMGLAGPGLPGFGGLGPLQRMKLRMQAWWARTRANKFMSVGVSGLGTPSPGPAPTMVNMVAPQMQAPMAMLATLAPMSNSRSVYGPVAAGAMALSRRRPYEWYYAG